MSHYKNDKNKRSNLDEVISDEWELSKKKDRSNAKSLREKARAEKEQSKKINLNETF